MATWHPPAVDDDGVSRLAEVGLEYEVKWILVVSPGAQYRLYGISGRDDPARSLEAGLALPVSIKAVSLS